MHHTHVIIGSGPTGQATAKLLASNGERVLVVNRSGHGEAIAGVQRVALDASNKAALQQATSDAAVIYNCANPAYTRWPTDWPPLANSILNSAKTSGAVLVTLSNLYGYAPPTRPIVETDPLNATSIKGQVRAQMWNDALQAHTNGDVRVTEARGSDFIGAVLGNNYHMGTRVTTPIKAGKTVNILGSPDAPHSWTAINDVAATLVELGSNPKAWGKAWHIPTAEPLSQRSIIELLCDIAEVSHVKVRPLPKALLATLSWLQPTMREIKEIAYQFDQPFVVDSSAATEVFGLQPTPIQESLLATLG